MTIRVDKPLQTLQGLIYTTVESVTLPTAGWQPAVYYKCLSRAPFSMSPAALGHSFPGRLGQFR